ncbi:hypothetical protein FB566_4884 [Stackebrandtia endophytica]|uniref:Pyridoxal phosphate homeostasis protein n=1 Tax=Stackebrandtia endophytica TaxID=1496996 RepID=A0A543B399_9ACTN|nr:YggS family pyridoxal phosphate-dependent enzyme [Stackebrandtia endophytica]TQL79283.1 hypothetical protein FB566_4884 [Stackebrandtia endophytica]
MTIDADSPLQSGSRPDDDSPSSRRQQIAEALRDTDTEIDDACKSVGRDRAEVKLVAVTKNFPADDVVHLARLGVTDVGENRDQEAAAKAAEVARRAVEVRWHFVGRLQRNKARSVAEYAHLVQSVDRESLARALDTAATRFDRRLGVLIQISLDGDRDRGGVVPGELSALVDVVQNAASLSLEGVMAVAPKEWEPVRAFEALAEHSQVVQRLAPQATEISAGMSGDFREAIACGATMVRLGAKLLGPRQDVGYPVR